MRDGFTDHYLILGVDPDCREEEIRKAFRKRLLEIHPDKTEHPKDPDEMRSLLLAFEVLSDNDRRDSYDNMWKIVAGKDPELSSIPHVTESGRPAARVRSVFYLLLEQRNEEALERLADLEPGSRLLLRNHLDSGEFVDACFLLGEIDEGRKDWHGALEWFEELIRVEQTRNVKRPCYSEALERAKKLLLKRTTGRLDPRVGLEYLRRAEVLGLDRAGHAEVAKKRASCYLEMEMKVEASKHFKEFMRLQPRAKGVDRLKSALQGYLDDE
ncbi:MAG: J domain-containing protein [Planctomycetota bacterium]|nr:J domain-containing protein [Planctomycetota bacterium]